jgi:CheY-like chemotaxis protein
MPKTTPTETEKKAIARTRAKSGRTGPSADRADCFWPRGRVSADLERELLAYGSGTIRSIAARLPCLAMTADSQTEHRDTAHGSLAGKWDRAMLPYQNEIAGGAPAPTLLAPTPTSPGLKVLVVEDNVGEADGLQRLLQSWGHESRVAPTGFHGLHEARRWLPDALIVDVRLPGALDGLAVARILRRNPGTAKARFIGVSGAPEIVDRSSERAAFDHFLPKPIHPDGLRGLLRERMPSSEIP